MKSAMIALAVLAAFAAAPAQANPLEERLEVLTSQVLTLQRELAVLKSMLARDATGNLTFTVTGSRTDRVGLNASTTVGANSSSSVGGDMTAAIGKSSTTQIGGNATQTVAGGATQTVGGNALDRVNGSSTSNVAVNSAISIGGSATRQVGGSSTDTVNGNASQQVGGSMGVMARNLTLEAADQLTLKSGFSSIVMKKSGEILITGAILRITASGDLILKGARVQTN